MYGAPGDDGFCQVPMINAILFLRPVAQQVKLCNCSRAPITGRHKGLFVFRKHQGSFRLSLSDPQNASF